MIAGDHGLVKIGSSTNPDVRLAALQTGTPHRLEIAYALAAEFDATAIEAEAHRLLAKQRCAGEWFDVSPERAIAAVNEAGQNLGMSQIVNLGELLDGTAAEPKAGLAALAPSAITIAIGLGGIAGGGAVLWLLTR